MRAHLGVALGRQGPHDRVEQVGDAAPVAGRDRERVVPAERVELGGAQLALLVVGLVGGDEHGLGRAAQELGGVLVGGRRAGRGVDHEHDDVRLVDREPRLDLDLLLDRVAGRDLEAARVDDDEPPAVPLGVAVEAVAGRPCPVLDDRRARVADDAVEQRGLADVGSPDEGDDRHAGRARRHGQAAPAETLSPGSEVVRPAGVAAASRAVRASSAARACSSGVPPRR